MRRALLVIASILVARCDRARPPSAATDQARATHAPIAAGSRGSSAPTDPPANATQHPVGHGDERCESPRHGRIVTRTLAACDPREIARARAFAPDALVVLGGGLLLDDEPSCATLQRARAALELADAIGPNVALLLSGRGPSRAPIRMDDAESTCLRARLEDELDARSASDRERRSARDRLSAVLGTDRASLTEADGMCAAILRRVERAQWSALTARMQFDPASTDTVQNADFSTPLLERSAAQRALIVTSPVRHEDGSIDNHPERALGDFRAARARTHGRFLLGAIGCPYVDGGPSWASFEPTGAAR